MGLKRNTSIALERWGCREISSEREEVEREADTGEGTIQRRACVRNRIACWLTGAKTVQHPQMFQFWSNWIKFNGAKVADGQVASPKLPLKLSFACVWKLAQSAKWNGKKSYKT